MAETLEAAIDLATDAAMASIQEIGSALDSAVTSVSPVVLEADASAIPGEIDAAVSGASATVAVDGDTAEAVQAIDDVAATAEGTSAAITVTADDAEAQQSIDALIASMGGAPDMQLQVDDSEVIAAQESVDGLGSSMDEAGSKGTEMSGGMDKAKGSAAGLSAASAGLSGNLKGAVTGFAEATGASTGMVAGVGAAAVAVTTFLVAGEKMEAGLERMTLVFGKFAAEAESINIGGLNGQLADLAIKAGSSPAVLRQASAALGQVVQSAGLTKEASAGVANQFQALALRAVAMNPQLGEAGDVLTGLQRGLAMGGRFAAKFGLGMLNAGEIAARAAEMFNKPATALTVTEKAMAGAQIAVEKLGPALGKDFAAGIDQSAVKLKSLVATLKGVIAEIGKPFIPLLAGAAQILGPLVQMASAINDIMVPTLLLRAGMSLLADVMKFLAPIISTVTGAISDFIGAAADFVGGAIMSGVEDIAGAFASLGEEIAGVAVDVADFVGGAISDLFGVLTDIGGVVLDVGGALFDVFGGPLVGIIEGAVGALGDFVGALGDVFGAIGDLFSGGGIDANIQQIASSTTAAAAAAVDFGHLFKAGFVDAGDAVKMLKQVFAENEAAGRAFGRALVDLGVISQGQFSSAIGKGKKAIDDTKDSANNAKTALDNFKASLEALFAPAANVEQATLKFRDSMDALKQSLADNGNSFDMNTEAGRKNRQALLDSAQAAFALAEAQAKQDGNQQRATQTMNAYVQGLTAVMHQAGMTDEQIQAYLTDLGLTPEQIATALSLTGVPEAQSALAAYLGNLNLTPLQKQTIIDLVNAGASKETLQAYLDTLDLTPKQKETILSALDETGPPILSATAKVLDFGKLNPRAKLDADPSAAWPVLDLSQGKADKFGASTPTAVLGTTDNASSKILSAQLKSDKFGNSRPEATLGARDNASGTISHAQGQANAFQRTYTATLTATISQSFRDAMAAATALHHAAGGVVHKTLGAGGVVHAASGATLARLAVVGERGPELAALPIGTRVFTHAMTMNMLRQATQGGGVGGIRIDTIKVEVHGVDDPLLARQAGEAAAAGLADGLIARKIAVASRAGAP